MLEAYGEEEISAVTDALNSGWLGGQGPKSVEFEKIAKRFGKNWCFRQFWLISLLTCNS